MQELTSIRNHKEFLLSLAVDCLDKTNEHYLYNFFISSIINRAISLNRGFLTLKDDNNYLCAIPLLRMQVDNCLRFYALNLSDNKERFILDWAGGEKLSNHKIIGTNIKMTDKNLKDKIAVSYPKIGKIYDAACNFVHLSQENLYNTCKVKPGTRTVNTTISGYDMIPDDVKDNIDKCMLYSNNILAKIIRDYSTNL